MRIGVEGERERERETETEVLTIDFNFNLIRGFPFSYWVFVMGHEENTEW